MRNIGFSDAAELFVFLSGVSVAIAYGKRLQRKGYVSTAMHILRRTWTLYIAHVFVLTQLMAMLFIVNDHVLTRDYVNEMGLRYFLDNPKQALVASSLLKFRPGLMDPLPLYIVLLGMFVVALPLMIRRPLITFCYPLSCICWPFFVSGIWKHDLARCGFLIPLRGNFCFSSARYWVLTVKRVRNGWRIAVRCCADLYCKWLCFFSRCQHW